jgi:NAD(P)-dependent dehydrogenase (short-subunit alcohol dehydrogenase family)
MGEAEARLFAAEGARVVVADILAADAEAVVAAIRAGGGDYSPTREPRRSNLCTTH